MTTLTLEGPSVTGGNAIQNTYLPVNHVIEFDVPYDFIEQWGIVIRYLNDGSHFRLTGGGGSWYELRQFPGNTLVWIDNQQNGLYPQYPPLAEYGHVECSFNEVRYGDNTTNVYHIITLWVNGKWVFSYAYNYGLTALEEQPRFGLYAPPGLTKVYDNVRVRELGQSIEWATIDPNERPLNALLRVIDGLHIRYFARFNGALRVWRPKAKPSAHTYVTGDLDGFQSNFDKRQLYSHARVTGGYVEANAIRMDLLKRIGSVFTEINNPYLLSEAECLTEAQRALKRFEEGALTESFGVPHTPFLEPEDRITVRGNDRLITAISIEYTGPKHGEVIEARDYKP